MTDLLNAVIAAHGGLERWRKFEIVEATIISGGKLWEIKGQPQDPTPRRMTVALHREWASVQPFGAPDQKTFDPSLLYRGDVSAQLLDRDLSRGLWPASSSG